MTAGVLGKRARGIAANAHGTCVGVQALFMDNCFIVMCSGSEAGSYLRCIDSWITQLKVQGPCRVCNERKEEANQNRTCEGKGL